MQAFTGFYRLRVPRFQGVNTGAVGCWCGNRCGTEAPSMYEVIWEWLSENNPAALELCPYKVLRPSDGSSGS